MRRRAFLTALGLGAIAWPAAARAQQPKRTYRIMWMSTEAQPDPFVDGFREGMLALGYIEGRDFVIELRYAHGNPDALRTAVADLVRAKPDLVVSSGPAIRAMREAKDVPVVFAISGDPIELGVAKTLARPGSNFTGSTFLSLDLAAKRVELIKEALPSLRRLAIFSNAQHPGEGSELKATLQAAQAAGVTPHYVPFKGPGEFDQALAALKALRADAMLTFPDGVTMVHRAKIGQFAAANALPSMFGWREYCDAGGLMSYGANQRAAHVRLATFADRVLRGEKPGDIPIEQPSRFELVVNLKTAKALGVTLAQNLLVRADVVLE